MHTCFAAAVSENRRNLVQSIAYARQAGSKILFDLNYRFPLWSSEAATNFVGDIMPHIDIAKISDEEFDLLFPDIGLHELSSEYHGTEWVFTCGGDRAEIWKAGVLNACH